MTTSAGRGVRMTRDRIAPYTRLSAPSSGDWRLSGALRSRMKHSAGVIVSATSIETSTARP